MTRAHDYSGYTGGCRCDTCRAAKAAYMRGRRGAARREGARDLAETGERRTVQWISHGTTGYYEYGCRCERCLGEKAAHERRRYPRVKARRQAARSAA